VEKNDVMHQSEGSRFHGNHKANEILSNSVPSTVPLANRPRRWSRRGTIEHETIKQRHSHHCSFIQTRSPRRPAITSTTTTTPIM